MPGSLAVQGSSACRGGCATTLPGGLAGQRRARPSQLAGLCIMPVTHGSLAPALPLAWAQPGDGPGRLSSMVLFALVPYLARLFLSLFIYLLFYWLLPSCLPPEEALLHKSFLVLILRASGALLLAWLVPNHPSTASSSPLARFPIPNGLFWDTLLLGSLHGAPRKQTCLPGEPFGKRVCKGLNSATQILCSLWQTRAEDFASTI